MVLVASVLLPRLNVQNLVAHFPYTWGYVDSMGLTICTADEFVLSLFPDGVRVLTFLVHNEIVLSHSWDGV